MKIIESYEEYAAITGKYRKNCDYSNVFFLKNQVNSLVNAGKLSFLEADSNLYLFERCEGFSRFYFFINKDVEAGALPIKDTLVVEFVFNEPAGENQANSVQYLKRLGFKLGRRSIRMTLHNIGDFQFEEAKRDQKGIEIRYAEESDSETIRKLLLSHFDPKYAYIPAEDELIEIIKSKRIIAASHDNNIIGFEHFEIKNKVLTCWHILVTPEYQGRGIGRQLFSESHKRAAGVATSGQIWLREDNKPAMTMYRLCGYEFNGRRSDEYVLIDTDER